MGSMTRRLREQRRDEQWDKDLERALRFVALSDDERLELIQVASPEVEWFCRKIDELAEGLHVRGWVRYAPFNEKTDKGAVVVTVGRGDVRKLVMAEAGAQYLKEKECIET